MYYTEAKRWMADNLLKYCDGYEVAFYEGWAKGEGRWAVIGEEYVVMVISNETVDIEVTYWLGHEDFEVCSTNADGTTGLSRENVIEEVKIRIAKLNESAKKEVA